MMIRGDLSKGKKRTLVLAFFGLVILFAFIALIYAQETTLNNEGIVLSGESTSQEGSGQAQPMAGESILLSPQEDEEEVTYVSLDTLTEHPESSTLQNSSEEDFVYINLSDIEEISSILSTQELESNQTSEELNQDRSENELRSLNSLSLFSGDEVPPEIKLISPKQNEVFNNKILTFEFNVSDSGGLTSCNFTLSYYNQSTSLEKIILNKSYGDLESSFELNLNFSLENEGDYRWEVGCYDPSGNSKESSQDFSILQPQWLNLELISSPTLLKKPYGALNFSFSVNSSASEVQCLFELNRTTYQFSKSAGNISITQLLVNGNYTWYANCSQNVSLTGSIIVDINYTPSIHLGVSKTTLYVNESVVISLGISSEVNQSISYSINYGDSNSSSQGPTLANLINASWTHSYKTSGAYLATLTVTSGGNETLSTSTTLNVVFVQVNQTQNTTDTSVPKITLISPTSDSTLREDNVTFTYNISDSGGLANCSLSIYFYNTSLNIGNLVYQTVQKNLGKNASLKNDLNDFDEGDYSWEVGCYDTSGNYKESSLDFRIFISELNPETTLRESTFLAGGVNESYDKKEQIEELVTRLNSFISSSENYDEDTRDALEDMGIPETMQFYKKKLLQIKLDLQHNLDFVSDIGRREQRRIEIYSDLANISLNVPEEVKVVETHEYTKNSLDTAVSDIVKEYISQKGIILSKGSVSSYEKGIAALQSRVVPSVIVRRVNLDYGDRKKEITLIKKQLEIKNATYDSVIEVIPKDIAESSSDITFITKHSLLQEGTLYEITKDDLGSGVLVYSINHPVDPKLVEKTDTLIFSHSVTDSNSLSITGYSVLLDMLPNEGIFIPILWGVFILIIIILLLYSTRKRRIRKVKKNPVNHRAFIHLQNSRRSIQAGEIDLSKEHYQKLKETYPTMTPQGKKLIFKEILNIKLEIDRKDFARLLTLCDQARLGGNTEEAQVLSQRIREIYNQLPKHAKKEFYDKVRFLLS